MATAFENFVNTELPKRIATNESPTTPQAGDIPVFTGVGLLTESKTASEAGLATSSQLTDKADLVDGLVPANQLPSYVDDVLEYANLASFPLLGEASKLYIAIDTNLVYRWGGSTYAVTSSSLALGDTSTTAYRGDRGKTAYDHSQATGNPHNLPAASTGADGYLTSSDWNTFNGKQAALASGTNIKTINGNNILGSGDLALFTPRISAVTNPAYTLQAADNDGNTYLRVDTASSAAITIPSTQTTPITIRRVTSQSVTLQGGLGVTLNGSLTFDVVGSTKSIIPIGPNQFDIVG